MAKPFNTNQRKVKLPKSQHEFEEFGGGKKGLVFCPDCRAAYYKKSWHHSEVDLKSAKENMQVTFVRCPACQMVKNHQYEGKIVIKNAPANLREELMNLIRGFGERAYHRDPMDRVIEAKKEGKDIVVTTTENQLANKLAKKIQSTYNNVKAKTSFMKEPSDTALAIVEFLGK